MVFKYNFEFKVLCTCDIPNILYNSEFKCSNKNSEQASESPASPRDAAETAVAYSTLVNTAMLFLLAHSPLNDHKRLCVLNIHDQM